MLTCSTHLIGAPCPTSPHFEGYQRRKQPRACLCLVLIACLFLASAQLIGTVGAHTGQPCPCRFPGGVAPPGAVICLEVDGKRLLARCEMVLNNSSWRFLGESCPIAALPKMTIWNG